MSSASVPQQRPREGRARSWHVTWASFAAALLLSPAPAAYAEEPPASAPAATARATGTAAPTAARLHVVGAARAGSPTTIRAALTPRPRVRSYRWHFDDARRDVTGAGTPTLVRHTFRTSGRHEVRLTLTSDLRRQTRVTLRLHVAGALRPAGAAPAPTAPMAPGTPPTTASGSTRSTRLTIMGRGDRAERDGWSARDENTVFRFGGDTRGADADRWAIDYGDGNTATGLGALPPTLTHTYLSSGAPTVVARLTSSDGTTVAASTTLEVTDAELVELSCPRTAVVGQPVTCDVYQIPIDDEPTLPQRWSFTWGDGTAPTTDPHPPARQHQQVPHTYDQVGRYMLEATFVDDHGGLLIFNPVITVA